MSDMKRLTNRNAQVAAMLADGEQLKNFYRFIAQNPHINLHDACQIVIERPNATVCFSFNEWAAMDRRVTKGRKGIAYYDNDGYNREVSPYEDNMLKITSDGKKLALDPRCFVPESADEAGSKLNVASEYIHEIWERTSDIKGTQIVFCDLSTPKKRFEDYEYGTDFDAYNDLKYKLVQRGIPPEEIAYIHEANTDEQDRHTRKMHRTYKAHVPAVFGGREIP